MQSFGNKGKSGRFGKIKNILSTDRYSAYRVDFWNTHNSHQRKFTE